MAQTKSTTTRETVRHVFELHGGEMLIAEDRAAVDVATAALRQAVARYREALARLWS